MTTRTKVLTALGECDTKRILLPLTRISVLNPIHQESPVASQFTLFLVSTFSTVLSLRALTKRLLEKHDKASLKEPSVPATASGGEPQVSLGGEDYDKSPMRAISSALIIKAAAGQVGQLAPHGHQLYHHLLAKFLHAPATFPAPLPSCRPVEELQAHTWVR